MKFDSMKYWNIEVLASQAVWKWKQQAKPFLCVLMPIIILTGSEALVGPLMFSAHFIRFLWTTWSYDRGSQQDGVPS